MFSRTRGPREARKRARGSRTGFVHGSRQNKTKQNKTYRSADGWPTAASSMTTTMTVHSSTHAVRESQDQRAALHFLLARFIPALLLLPIALPCPETVSGRWSKGHLELRAVWMHRYFKNMDKNNILYFIGSVCWNPILYGWNYKILEFFLSGFLKSKRIQTVSKVGLRQYHIGF